MDRPTFIKKYIRALRLIGVSALDTVFPRTCRVCGRTLVHGEELMCISCMSELPRTYLHNVEFNTMHQRIGGDREIDVASGWFYYYSDSPYARLIHEAKYNDRPATARLLGRLYGAELATDGLTGHFDVLLPVPLHRDKLLKRGYNQSLEVARGLARELDCEVGDNLMALRGHKTQTRRSGYERYDNVRGSFGVMHPEELDGLSVAIVDDVVTTGSTVLDCINALTAAATPARISVLSIGVTHMR